MKKYLEPELEVVRFTMEDVINTSVTTETTDPNELPLVPVDL